MTVILFPLPPYKMTTNETPLAEYAPRGPTEKERKELRQWIKKTGICAEPDDWSETSWITVFDRYCTDCPGYSGKVMIVLWGGGPDCITVFTWKDGTIRHDSSHADCN